MSIALVTGSAGLIGAESVRFLARKGLDVVGIDNDMRRYFFGPDASTKWCRDALLAEIKEYSHFDEDIRDRAAIDALFSRYGRDISLIIHTAAQPSHDWAAREPVTDFEVNANGTLNLLEATRRHCPEAAFIFISTNKVYGDAVNQLPLVEQETRWELDPDHPYAAYGIDEEFPVDQTLHSLFGASKLAADVLVQEYGRSFGMKTACFRGGCLTGPGHSGAELHGFLAYLVQCAITEAPYTIFGYSGKQVRDNIHSSDLVSAFWHYFENPRPGEVYNLGGGRFSNCSMLEAVRGCEQRTGREMNTSYDDSHRTGDHIWWVSDVRKFQSHYPKWELTYSIDRILDEIFAGLEDRLGDVSRGSGD
jgi:CDP-paratose 2-epimerase